MHSVRVDVDDAVDLALPDGAGGAGGQAGRLGAVVAGHVHLVGEHVGVVAALDVHDAAEARTRRQAVLVLAGDLAGAAADAIDVVVHEAELHGRLHRLVDLALLALGGVLDLGFVFRRGHGSAPRP